ncbi:hypothetical protein MBLNU459_g4181t1 [Dothideomycetes sp. NU459]
MVGKLHFTNSLVTTPSCPQANTGHRSRSRRRLQESPSDPASVAPADGDQSPLFEPQCDDGNDDGNDDFRRGSIVNGVSYSEPGAPGQDDASRLFPSDDQDDTVPASGFLQTQRYTYRDTQGVLREIWQPGDPSGERDGELVGAARPKTRFRFFQHDIGPIIRGFNSPPKYVILDDKAVYDIMASAAYKPKELAKYWYHDFNQSGAIRNRRVNRGRPALVDEDEGDRIDTGDSQGERIVAWAPYGKGKRYHFTGERNGYKSVQFATKAVKTPIVEEARQSNKPSADCLNPPRTPRHERPQVDTYLYATPSPPWPGMDRRKRQLGDRTPRGAQHQSAYEGPEWAHQGLDGSNERDAPLSLELEDSEVVGSGSKTVFAGMKYDSDGPNMEHENDFPDRDGGRIKYDHHQKELAHGTIGHNTHMPARTFLGTTIAQEESSGMPESSLGEDVVDWKKVHLKWMQESQGRHFREFVLIMRKLRERARQLMYVGDEEGSASDTTEEESASDTTEEGRASDTTEEGSASDTTEE